MEVGDIDYLTLETEINQLANDIFDRESLADTIDSALQTYLKFNNE